MSKTRLGSQETPTEGKVQAPFCRKSSQGAGAVRPRAASEAFEQ
jgi:hypothetical protein